MAFEPHRHSPVSTPLHRYSALDSQRVSGLLGWSAESREALASGPAMVARVTLCVTAETVTAAVFAFRSKSQPAIVQVSEIATATMIAARGAIYPVHELMRDQHGAFSPAAYLAGVVSYYADANGNLLSFPFNASTPILYYNKKMFRDAGLDPEAAPRTWPEVGLDAKRLRDQGVPCGFTTSWPSWRTA